jgi:hypothetical protein
MVTRYNWTPTLFVAFAVLVTWALSLALCLCTVALCVAPAPVGLAIVTTNRVVDCRTATDRRGIVLICRPHGGGQGVIILRGRDLPKVSI